MVASVVPVPGEGLDPRSMRIDLEESLAQGNLNIQDLSPFQRVLLATDGTVTDILEAHMGEAIRIVKIDQGIMPTPVPVPYLEAAAGVEVMIRKVLLKGKLSHLNFIYAESIIVPEHLEASLRDGLVRTQKPIGQLILQHRLETFREILVCRLERAEELGAYFDIEADAMIISRTYRVFAHGRPLMLITEKFPRYAFRD